MGLVKSKSKVSLKDQLLRDERKKMYMQQLLPEGKRLNADRRVEIGLNVIAFHDIDDANHSFTCNLLMHIKWNALPLDMKPDVFQNSADVERLKPFFPWIQLHNIGDVNYRVDPDTENKGMLVWNRDVLQDHIREHVKSAKYAQHFQKNNKALPCFVLENVNMVATFITELDLRAFPFDCHTLPISIVANETHKVNLTHKVVREADEANVEVDGKRMKWKYPKENQDSKYRAIKCNLEGDTLSEWFIWMSPLEPKPESAEEGGEDVLRKESAKAIAVYRFREHDPSMSAEGNIYQRLDFYVVAQREWVNVLMVVIGPTAMLCLGALSIWAIQMLDDGTGTTDRLSILFTIVLAIIANSIATQDRLPRLDYMTWADKCLNFMQLLVYLQILMVSVIRTIADSRNEGVADWDAACRYITLGMYGIFFLWMLVSGAHLHHSQAMAAEKHLWLDRMSFWLEEERLFYVENGLKVEFESPPGGKDADQGKVVVNVRG